MGESDHVQTKHWRLGHRPALDGLRGIAALLVIAAHLNIPGFAGGGATGVTLFFALSGFLITALLLEDHARGGIRWLEFYRRRALRLLPALLLVVIAFSAWDAKFERANVARDALAAIFYVANFARARGYQLGSLSHTWSLAVEEQFYFTWPLVLTIVARRPRVTAPCLVIVAA